MRNFNILGLSLLLCLTIFGCTKHIVTPASCPSKKLIVLPDKYKGRGYEPYVINGERYYPLPDSDGFVEYGNASWYGEDFHGRPTSSGETYDMYKISAAHKILPLGTYVQATNLANGKEIIVRINDRGPFVKGRVIDFSYAAAKQIGLVGPGVARIRLVALGKEVGKIESSNGRSKHVIEVTDLTCGEFTVQVGAFKSRDNALRLCQRLRSYYNNVDVEFYNEKYNGPLYRVRVSKTKTLTEAKRIEKELEDKGFNEAFIIGL